MNESHHGGRRSRVLFLSVPLLLILAWTWGANAMPSKAQAPIGAVPALQDGSGSKTALANRDESARTEQTQPSSSGCNYTVAQYSGAALTAGTSDTGNHCDDCLTYIDLPF